MGSLKLQNIQKSFGKVEVLKGIDLEVEEGEFVVFVGPSGCGKSTLLRIIAGLEDTTSGAVLIDGEQMNNTPPAKRGIAMVFQTYALYPHLNVRNNMSLGLKQAGAPAEVIDKRVAASSAMLSLEPYLERRPAELSGGQRQRVAIGRALVRDPKLFLFDEPLSNLDAALRVNTRLEIAKLHHELKATMVYVTHDQVEAMTLADKIVVLNAGRIEQVGAPMQLYNSPANEFVAGFIGSPKMNFIPGARLGETAKTVGVRPEHISVSDQDGTWKGTVVHAEHLGADTNLYLKTDKAGLITVRIFGEYRAEPGATLFATPDLKRTYRFDDSGTVMG
jgi:multiple sugar transport system ATP-binding protein